MAPAADDDDDMDPFGDETEEEKKAAEEKEGAKKDTKKPKGSHSLWFGERKKDRETEGYQYQSFLRKET